jgi:hypothetical protein
MEKQFEGHGIGPEFLAAVNRVHDMLIEVSAQESVRLDLADSEREALLHLVHGKMDLYLESQRLAQRVS